MRLSSRSLRVLALSLFLLTVIVWRLLLSAQTVPPLPATTTPTPAPLPAAAVIEPLVHKPPPPPPPPVVMGVTKEVQQEGNGQKPVKGQKITVHCTGYLADGNKKFWSTADPGQKPFAFNVGIGQVIKGWDEGFMSMSLGEKARLTMTGDYAYGASGFPAWNIPPNATLIFDVEILSIA